MLAIKLLFFHSIELEVISVTRSQHIAAVQYWLQHTSGQKFGIFLITHKWQEIKTPPSQIHTLPNATLHMSAWSRPLL